MRYALFLLLLLAGCCSQPTSSQSDVGKATPEADQSQQPK